MRIGIFGGSFNPPHKMHERIAKYLVTNNIIDYVIFVPTGSKYKYKTNLISDEDRYKMVKIITDKYKWCDTSDFELKSRTVYTYETLKHYQELYQDADIYFICGLDNLSYIDSWKESDYILSNYHILVIKRKTDDLKEVLKRLEKYQDNIIVTDLEEEDISSTDIRKNIESTNINNLLDKDVLAYIKEHNLYIG